MAIEIKQQLRLTQQLVMTPQLQQAIKLLQLSRLELLEAVQQELQDNPVLEEVVEGEETREAGAEGSGDGGESAPGAESAPVEAESGGEGSEAAEAPEEREDFEPSQAEKIADIDWQSYAEAYPQTGFASEVRDDERPSFEANLTRRETLAEHLLWQLQLSDAGPKERAAAEWIIGNLDDDGYLRATLEEIAESAHVDLETVERALRRVQGFDPTGVAARDLRECLLLQVEALGIEAPLVRTLIEDHLPALERRDLRAIARGLGVTVEEVARAERVIASLEPRPGRPFGGDEPIYIVPDIYVYKVGDDYHIVLNDDGLPRLRINQLYRDVLARRDEVSRKTRDYVQEKVRSALWLIKSIHQRQRTMYKVMQSIVKHQREFFEKGIQYLRPLNLRDVAEDIGMHESTVSRVTTNKYVHTPQGVFELKFFFNSSINRVNGEAIASESVKDRIRRIIANEDPRRPLSDQRIAEMLRAANIDIARRTVTKYRESMNILSSTKRRRIG